MKFNKTVGIICEYNPFHSGHHYQIEKVRSLGFDRVVCVMSGNSVQRGELAITDKYIRAEIAVNAGADLILELPFPFSSSSAEFFALAGVRILENAGVDAICFGSECGDIDKLRKAADVCESEAFTQNYKDLVSRGRGATKAFFEAYECVTQEKLPGGANDILAISYLRALKKENSPIEPIAIKRKGSDYRDKSIEALDEHPSATMLRNCLLESGIDNKFEKIVPKETLDVLKKAVDCGKAPVQMSNLDSAIVASLRLFDCSRLENIADAGGGLGRKILSAAHDSTTYEELVSLAAGKHYTDARVRRTILNILLGVRPYDLKAYPAYTTILGFNDRGREILSELRKKERIPFITKPADASELGDEAKRQKELSDRCDSLYTLALPIKGVSAEYIKRSPFIKQ